MKPARFIIIEQTDRIVLIQDIGPWSRHLTVTNDAENVVARLAAQVGSRELHCIDSECDRDRILIKDGRFDGFDIL